MRHDEVAADIAENDETPTPLRRRKAHIRESNEAHLLACAEAVFAERGLEVEDWHRAADTFEGSDDPVEAISGYVRAKMELSRRRPLGSKVWANEIIHGAEHMQDILTQRVKPWLESRVTVIDDWIARGLLAPVSAQTLMYMIWATTQHYADFDAQILALGGKRALTQKAFNASTEEVVQLVIRACGAVSPTAR
jgi:TetR/AcrR family transcriptional regulator